MLKRTVSWGTLLFSFVLIVLSNVPTDNKWSVTFNKTYFVPDITMPASEYQIVAVIALVSIVFLFLSSFRNKWAESVENFISKHLYSPFFIIFWAAFTVGFLKGVGLLIPSTQPKWLVTTVFYVGYAVFLMIPILYFKWFFTEQVKRKTI